MSAVPVFGHAVQAPIVIAPNAVPRVRANCVSPRPKIAATANDEQKSDQQAHLTVSPAINCRGRRSQPTRARIAGVRTRRALLVSRRARRARAMAFSIMRSTRSSTSIARFVSMVGRGAAGSRASGAAATCGAPACGAGGTPGIGLHLDALMRIGHDLVPCHRRERAAGHAVGRRIVVVAEPHPARR